MAERDGTDGRPAARAGAIPAPGDAARGARPPWRELSASLHLAVMVVAILVPLAAAAGLGLWRYAEAERARGHRAALDLAGQVGLDVDREVDGALLMLRALATSPSLAAGDLAAFAAQARRVVGFRGESVSLRDRAGRQLVNTRVPPDAPLPLTGAGEVRAADARLFATGEPQVSGLYVGTVARSWLVLVDVPVARDGAVAYALSLTLAPGRLSALLAARLPSPEWVASLVDGNGTIAARSRQAARFVGAAAAADYRRNAVGDEGAWTGANVEGVPVLAAFVRSRLTGWRVGVGVPVALVEAPLRSLLALLLAGVALVLALPALLAAWWGRRLTRPVRLLAEAAAALGRGEPVRPVATTVREVNLVGDELAAAAAALSERARERDAVEAALRESEQRYRTLTETSPEAVYVHRDGVVILANARAASLFGATGPDDLVGRSVFGELVDPSSLPMALARTARLAAAPGARNELAEMTFRRLDGAPVPVEAASSAMLLDGAPAVQVVLRDIGARLRAEERRRLLLRELSHRVKNTLAVVRGIAARTLSDDRAPAEARAVLAERLAALARAHDLLTASGWSGAGLRSMLEGELAPYGARAALDGPDLVLSPEAAQSLGLALHELATNAAKHGALAVPGGRVEVAWEVGEVAAAAGGAELRLRWRERDGPPVAPPTRRGFGRTLIERGLAHDLGGAVAMEFRPGGLVCELRMPTGVALASWVA